MSEFRRRLRQIVDGMDYQSDARLVEQLVSLLRDWRGS